MAAKQIVPALGLDSFSCPHVNCGAIAHQTWFKLFIDGYEKDSGPWRPNADDLASFRRNKDADARVIKFIEDSIAGRVFFETHSENTYVRTELINVYASKC